VIKRARELFPGTIIAFITALSAQYLAELYAAPVMLFALLLGMALNFLSEQENCCPGIQFSSTTVLRVGVALLGLRITLYQVHSIGYANLLVVALGVAATMLLGTLLAKWYRQAPLFGLLTGGSVAICGASAAMAISAVLPHSPHREKQVVFTVLCVTTLSTIAMILYPLIVEFFDLTDSAAGIFIGGTIHDVAQVVGAGYGISTEVGDIATITKLFRVLMLLPVFLVLGYIFRGQPGSAATGKLPLPWFVSAFVVLMLVATIDLLPTYIVENGLRASRFCLIMAITALGMKTNLRILVKGSGSAILLVLIETLFLGGMILAWIIWNQAPINGA